MPDRKKLQIGYNSLRDLRIAYDALKADNNDKVPSTYAPLRKYAQELSWLVESFTTKAGFVPKMKFQVGPNIPSKLDAKPVDTEAPKASDVGLDDNNDGKLTTRKETKKDDDKKGSKGQTDSGTKGGGKGSKTGGSKGGGNKSNANQSGKGKSGGDK